MHWYDLFILASVIATGFLIYSVVNREKLGIGLTHPRIFVEADIAIIGLAVWLWLRFH